MKEKLAEPVFAVAERRYDWADVVLWATHWGDWGGFEARVRLGVACARREEEGAEDVSLDEGEVEEAANEFRYERDLLSVEDLDAWLRRYGLSAEVWMACMERAVLRRKWADEGETILAGFPVSDEDLEAALWSDGICSGELSRYARDLAARASVHARLRQESEAFEGSIECEAEALLAPAIEDPAGALLGLEAAARREKLAHLARLEAALGRFSAEALTTRAIHEQISTRYLDWIHLDCHVVSFGDEQAAREAALSVREDGLDLSEVAELARAAVRETRIYLDEAEPTLREHLLSAAKGDLVGPLSLDRGFVLILVRDKVMPTESDPEIRRRVEQALIERLLAREVDARVQWLLAI